MKAVQNKRSNLHPDNILKAKFQIGSVHGRVNYNNEERVFHQGDVPTKAREAKREVNAFLQTDVLRTHTFKPNWNIQSTAGPSKSYMKKAPWDGDGWDDRHFVQIETKALVETANERLKLIKSGLDPRDIDPRAINPRWDSRQSIDPRQRRLLESRAPHKERDPQGGLMARGAVLIPPAEKRKQAKNRPSLIQRHNAKHREERRAKKHARLVHERDFTSQDTLSSAGHERCWDEYPVDTNERHYAASLHTASPKEIQERLEGTYTKEVLEELLEEQEGKIQAERERKERERKARTVKREADKKFRVPKGGTSNGKYLAYREERPTPRKGKGEFPRWKCGAVGIYDAEGRSFYQTSTRSQHTHSYDSSRSRLLSRQSEKKRKKLLRDSDTIIKTYEHTGVWEKSAAMGGMVWSCCMNEEKDSKGCRARTVFNQSRWNVASV